MAWLLPMAAAAATAADEVRPSTIDQVTVYPGLAVVERSAKVATGARELVLDCLSSAFDMASLRIDADAGVVIGPVNSTSRPRAEAPECDNAPREARIRSLEDRIAVLDADRGGYDLVLGYLRALAPGDSASAARGAAPAPVSGPALQAMLGAIQRGGQGALVEQHRLDREREALTRELKPLLTERERLRQSAGEVRRLRISLSAAREGSVRLQYQVPGPTWAPAYRATLDTVSRRVDIERLAQVSQRSGEDWVGVSLRLSTGSPRAATGGPQPRTWEVYPRPPMVAPMMAPPPAPASAPAYDALAQRDRSSEVPLEFAVQVNQGEFATEFALPGRVDVASGSQSVSLSIANLRLPAAIKVQATPHADASAWVIAEVARPDGVWPDGPLQLIRGTQAVGQGVWRTGQREPIALAFGRDELVRVQVNPAQQRNSSAGFIGNRTERRISRVYEVENRHVSAIELRVLEASPVSKDEQITVTRQFTPAPQAGDWLDQPGIVAWTQSVAPGQTARFGADYTISYPKDLSVSERY